MRSLKETMAWEVHEVEHGPARWRGLCMSHSRNAWGLPVQAPSAKSFFDYIHTHHPQHMFHDHYTNVPRGAIVLDPNLSRWGHAWISAGDGKGFSSDYVRSGHIDRVPLHLPRWRHGDTHVWWTDFSHQGALPIDMSHHGGKDRRV